MFLAPRSQRRKISGKGSIILDGNIAGVTRHTNLARMRQLFINLSYVGCPLIHDFEVHRLRGHAVFIFGQAVSHDHLQHVIARTHLIA